MIDDLATNKRLYMMTWIMAINAFLGWPREKVLGWAQQYDEGLNDVDSWFYHEGPLHYIVPLLIPERLQKSIGAGLPLRRLCWQLERAIEEAEPIPDWLLTKQDELSPTDFVKLCNEYHDEAVARGAQFSETHADKFDWAAARRRVNEILKEYGESLPNG